MTKTMYFIALAMVGLSGCTRKVQLSSPTAGTDSFSQAMVRTALAESAASDVPDSFSIDVRNFGAVGNGVTDDTAAILAAVARVQASVKAMKTRAGLTVVSSTELYFPAGTYLISDTIKVEASVVRIRSESGARIVQSAAAPIFVFHHPSGGGSTSVKIHGMKFLYGTNQLVFSNNNVNATMLKIEDCEFRESTDYAIKTIGTDGDLHMSAVLVIDNSKFFDVAGALENYADRATVRDSWVQASSLTLRPNTGIFLNHSGDLMFDNMEGVPAIHGNLTRVAGVHWVKFRGGNFIASRSRFGGEGAGYPVVSFDWDGTSGSSTDSAAVYPYMGPAIIIENSQLCAGGRQTPDAAVININRRFPHLIRLVGNYFLTDSYYIRVNNEADALAYIGSVPSPRDPKTVFKISLEPNMAFPFGRPDNPPPAWLTQFIQ